MRREVYVLIHMVVCALAAGVRKRGLPDGTVVNKCPENWNNEKCVCDINELTLMVTISCTNIVSEHELAQAFDETSWQNNRFEWFTLSNSELKSLSYDTLENMSFVGLIFTNVTVHNVSSSAFNGSARSCEHVWVTDSSLPDFNFQSLKPMAKLRSVAIMNSGLTEVPAESFSNFYQLEVVNLERNAIGEIGPMAFSRLPRLRRLELTGNNMSTLRSGVLNTTAAIYDVNVILKDNNIEKVLPGAFADLQSSNVHLENNRLCLLNQDAFEPLLDNMMYAGGGKLYVTGNPIICDDSVNWLQSKSKKYQEQIIGLDCPWI